MQSWFYEANTLNTVYVTVHLDVLKAIFGFKYKVRNPVLLSKEICTIMDWYLHVVSGTYNWEIWLLSQPKSLV